MREERREERCLHTEWIPAETSEELGPKHLTLLVLFHKIVSHKKAISSQSTKEGRHE